MKFENFIEEDSGFEDRKRWGDAAEQRIDTALKNCSIVSSVVNTGVEHTKAWGIEQYQPDRLVTLKDGRKFYVEQKVGYFIENNEYSAQMSKYNHIYPVILIVSGSSTSNRHMQFLDKIQVTQPSVRDPKRYSKKPLRDFIKSSLIPYNDNNFEQIFGNLTK